MPSEKLFLSPYAITEEMLAREVAVAKGQLPPFRVPESPELNVAMKKLGSFDLTRPSTGVSPMFGTRELEVPHSVVTERLRRELK